ncbi:sugar phosphate isomerase/epimerase, partial [Mesorhizobium sp. M1C.F.Ca.ET.196.01.1.1]
MSKSNQIVLHALVARYGTLALDLDIAHEIGFDGLEASGAKIRAFLDAGFSPQDLRHLVGETFIPGVGFLLDVERYGDARKDLLKDAEALTNLASAVGAKGIQVITGPISLEALDPTSVTRR